MLSYMLKKPQHPLKADAEVFVCGASIRMQLRKFVS